MIVTDNAPSLALISACASRISSGLAAESKTRVPEGVSTFVYRLTRGDDVYYLRVLPEPGASFAPEVYVHQLLRQHGVRVPEVVDFEHHDDVLQRSVMLTTALPGQPIGRRANADGLSQVMVEAGCDLARINQIPVSGFGWMRRDQPHVALTNWLAAEYPDQQTFVTSEYESMLAILEGTILMAHDVITIETMLVRFGGMLRSTDAWLTHGDFDVTHIFEQAGQYSDIIDFGEIRGAHQRYDLGHFLVQDGEFLSERVLPWLLEGYRQIVDLPDDADAMIHLWCLLIGLRTLAHTHLKHPHRDMLGHPLLPRVLDSLAVLAR